MQAVSYSQTHLQRPALASATHRSSIRCLATPSHMGRGCLVSPNFMELRNARQVTARVASDRASSRGSTWFTSNVRGSDNSPAAPSRPAYAGQVTEGVSSIEAEDAPCCASQLLSRLMRLREGPLDTEAILTSCQMARTNGSNYTERELHSCYRPIISI